MECRNRMSLCYTQRHFFIGLRSVYPMQLIPSFRSFLPWQPLLLLVTMLFLAACSSNQTKEEEMEGWSAEKIYEKSQQQMAAGAYQEVIETLGKLEARFPYGPYAQQAQLDSAYAYYMNEEPDAAIAAANRFIKLYPRSPKVDYAYYLRGLVTYTLEIGRIEQITGQDKADRDPQRIRQSFQYFDELVKNFPKSRYRADAVERMVKLRNTLADYEIRVADYYFRRGAYLAAANRAKYVVENYPKTPAIPEAVKLLSKAYDQLHLSDLAKDTRRVEELNPPNPNPAPPAHAVTTAPVPPAHLAAPPAMGSSPP